MSRKMNADQTNGALSMLEAQLQHLNNMFEDMNRRGELNDKAYEVFRKIRIDLINLGSDFSEVRGWNMTRSN